MTPLLLALSTAAAVLFSATPSATAGIGPAQQQQPAPAPPASTISAEIMVLHGLNDGSGIDPKIGKMPELSKPPFSSYNSYKQLDRTTLSIAKGKVGSHKLPTGRELQVLFKDIVAPGKRPARYLLSASIQTPAGKAFLPNVEVNANAGEWFFVAGQDYKGGSLVVAIKVNP